LALSNNEIGFTFINIINASKNGLTIDENAMYNHAISLGFTDDSILRIIHIYGLRLDMGGVAVTYEDLNFALGNLKTEEKYMNYKNDFADDIYAFLTNIFI
jgi:hypothetical protein